MEQRLQQINDDTVLEVTGDDGTKKRLSLNDLTRNRAYFEESIANFQAGLDDTNAKLVLIYEAQQAQ